jgi:hypothetical protein
VLANPYCRQVTLSRPRLHAFRHGCRGETSPKAF